MAFKFVPQHDQMDCGLACLSMIAHSFGKKYSLEFFRKHSHISKDGISLLGIIDAADIVGLETFPVKINIKELEERKNFLPCILHWRQNHYIVLRKIQGKTKLIFHIVDPDSGAVKLSKDDFLRYWISDHDSGTALFLNPKENFYTQTPPVEKSKDLLNLVQYLKPHKKSIVGIVALLFLGSIISLIFPFLTQRLIDKGVNAKNLNVITIILLAQLSLFLGNLVIELFRNWIMLIIGTKINISIISDFLKKLLRLPIKFFDTKLMGDFNQRIADHERIEEFLNSQSLITFFSMLTFLVFFGVLWYYNIQILAIYFGMTVLAVLWSLFWLKRRKLLDYLKFQRRSENQQSIYEMINGVTEMKLNQFEDYKRTQWEKIQYQLFKINIKSLKLNQTQQLGFELLNQIKNILVTFLAATLVIKGEMTLGALLSVSYIIGQMNGPINQLMSFFRSLQDAKLSLIRLNEVHTHNEEDANDYIQVGTTVQKQVILNDFNCLTFKVSNVSFQYEGPRSPYVLNDITLIIPDGKVTAIVGASGSGKTTLMKLLLKFYDPVSGNILLGDINLKNIVPSDLRSHIGAVMQDGFIFGDTIERNIVCGDECIDYDRLDNALHIANIQSYIQNLPLGLKTKIGASGNGISGGQKQRILIARAAYKNPRFLFFDEATSSLDAENEKIIHDNLQSFFKGKTVVIIAHRLSTVKNADQIIVLKHGRIVEHGSHQKLVDQRREYYSLVKNQLELGT